MREVGSHQQLLAQHGIYWKLYQLQYKDQEAPAPAAMHASEYSARGVSVSADS